MPRIARELTALEVKRLFAPGFHAVGGVPGLMLKVSQTGGRSWVLRMRIADRRRDIGLGAFPAVTLAQARDKARGMRESVAQGQDPLAERQASRAALLAEQRRRITFDQCAAEVVKVKKAESRNIKHAAQWESTLATYASPTLGDLPVSEIELAHVVRVLEPHWQTKTETMTRVRQRIEAVLSWATVRGYRKGDNPARWRGCLDAVLPKPSRVAKVTHHRALPAAEVGHFMRGLRSREGMAARALEFAILTAARSGEVRGACWEEIDLEARIWTIPAERMKVGKPHRVPLSRDALALLEGLPHEEGSSLVFFPPRGRQLSENAMIALLKRMEVDATAHGFRSTFRDWAAESTAYANEVAEKALAHSIRNESEAAYRRGDLLEKRRRLMDDWAKFCAAVPITGSVTPIRKADA